MCSFCCYPHAIYMFKFADNAKGELLFITTLRPCNMLNTLTLAMENRDLVDPSVNAQHDIEVRFATQ